MLRAGFHEEVERVDHSHVRHQIDGDRELAGRLWNYNARQIVTERILLPVDEVNLRINRQRVA